jgi:hypothetical protein
VGNEGHVCELEPFVLLELLPLLGNEYRNLRHIDFSYGGDMHGCVAARHHMFHDPLSHVVYRHNLVTP